MKWKKQNAEYVAVKFINIIKCVFLLLFLLLNYTPEGQTQMINVQYGQDSAGTYAPSVSTVGRPGLPDVINVETCTIKYVALLSLRASLCVCVNVNVWCVCVTCVRIDSFIHTFID